MRFPRLEGALRQFLKTAKRLGPVGHPQRGQKKSVVHKLAISCSSIELSGRSTSRDIVFLVAFTEGQAESPRDL